MDKQSASSRTKKAPADSVGTEGLLRQFEDSLRNYLREIQEAYQESQRRIHEESLKGSIPNDFQEAYSTYTQAVEKAWKKQDFQNYVEAQRELTQKLRRILVPEQVQTRFEAAYRNYLQELQKAWAQLDIKSVDAASLIAISQSLALAAPYAIATLGSDRQD